MPKMHEGKNDITEIFKGWEKEIDERFIEMGKNTKDVTNWWCYKLKINVTNMNWNFKDKKILWRKNLTL